MRLLLTLCFVFLLARQSVYAQCDCLWQGSFTDVQSAAGLVVSGEVIASKGNSIDLAVNGLLRGKEPSEPIRIWLKTGDYCRPEVALFPVGSEWVMALDEITTEVPGGFNPSTPNISYGRIGDYSLSSCGGYWLSVHDDRVTGNLVDGSRWDQDPPMTPVLLNLVVDYVQGRLDREALVEASKVDPALRQLMQDTRSFLRNEN